MSKKRRGRPRTGRRPVVSVRVHEPLYEAIRQSAGEHGLNISEEVGRRVQQSFDWERQFGDAKRLMAETQQAMKGELEAVLREKGYQRLRLAEGVVWAEPGMPIGPMTLSPHIDEIARALEPRISATINQAIRETLTKEAKS
jgi:hypothetical protein